MAKIDIPKPTTCPYQNLCFRVIVSAFYRALKEDPCLKVSGFFLISDVYIFVINILLAMMRFTSFVVSICHMQELNLFN